MTWLQRLTISVGAVLAGIIILATNDCVGRDPVTGMTCSEYEANPYQDVYFIVDASEIDNDDLFATAQQEKETLRWNQDNSQFVLKYNAISIPRDFVGEGLPLGISYDQSEIVTALENESWYPVGGFDAPIVAEEEKLKTFVEDDNFIKE